jgi:hypothetical protein
LITGWQRRAAALGAMLLSAGFAAAIGSALARGLELDCGCFGKGTPSAANLRLSLGRDAVFFAMAAWLYFRERRPAANKNPKLRRTGQSPARLDSQNESINP